MAKKRIGHDAIQKIDQKMTVMTADRPSPIASRRSASRTGLVRR
jgi:hypothetical protein